MLKAQFAVGSDELPAHDHHFDYLVAAAYLNDSAVLVASPSWGVLVGPGPGSNVTWQAVVLPSLTPLPNTPPAIGRAVIDSIDGFIDIVLSKAGIWYYGVGIYISKFDTRTSTWGVRSAISPADAARDDWLFLTGKFGYYNGMNESSAPSTVSVRLTMPPIQISSGEALHVVVSNSGNSSSGLLVAPYFRARLRGVS